MLSTSALDAIDTGRPRASTSVSLRSRVNRAMPPPSSTSPRPWEHAKPRRLRRRSRKSKPYAPSCLHFSSKIG
ncbi:uncharacterized protein J3R85_002230 [Psidium guajava]|nr:uncharacterized protein J3R85_002230 [Psidium guajava]